ncbi:hypothetical protein [Marinicellulosiphila megalodicopiae]|uniref:hypothetical protein n=1 Tax=Marinicellulosiphila megalodicopiae TaxID=2724896 RepID=UPI003BAF54A8
MTSQTNKKQKDMTPSGSLRMIINATLSFAINFVVITNEWAKETSEFLIYIIPPISILISEGVLWLLYIIKPASSELLRKRWQLKNSIKKKKWLLNKYADDMPSQDKEEIKIGINSLIFELNNTYK